MNEALQALGVRVERLDVTSLRIHGCAGRLPASKAALFLGNAGTAFRPLTAVLALAVANTSLAVSNACMSAPSGIWWMPCGRSVRVSNMREGWIPPLHVHPADIRISAPIGIRGDVSSQFLTALLMALPLSATGGDIVVRGELISKPYIEITLAMMRRFGVDVTRDGWNAFHVPCAVSLTGEIFVEGDASSRPIFLPLGSSAACRVVARCAWKASGRAAFRAIRDSWKCCGTWAP